MALPTSSTDYLPPLGACLEGDVKIISWNDVAQALSNVERAHQSSSLRTFLSDQSSFQALATSTRPSRPVNGQARSDFEARTAAINLGQSDLEESDLKQIKDDALWLANLTKIDGITALRTVVVDLQGGPQRRIEQGITEEERLSTHDAIDASSTWNRSASVNSLNGTNGKPKPDKGESSRRAQILSSWYREQHGLLMVRALLAARNKFPNNSSRLISNTAEEDRQEDWIESIHNRLCQIADSRQEYQDPVFATILQTVDCLHARVQVFKQQTRTLDNQQDYPWEHGTIQDRLQEVLDLLRVVFVLLGNMDQLLPTAVINHAFNVLAEIEFCITLPSILSQHVWLNDRIKALLALVLVRLLNLNATTQLMNDTSVSLEDSDFYVLDTSCVETITKAINRAVDNGAFHLAPVMICWVQIGKYIFSGAELDDPESSEAPRAITSSRTRKYIESWRAYTSLPEVRSNVLPHFGKHALDEFNVLNVLVKLADLMGDMLGELLLDSHSEHEIQQDLIDVFRSVCLLSNYSEALNETLLAIIGSGQTAKDCNGDLPSQLQSQLINDIFEDDAILCNTLDQARFRYPYEITPFVVICQSLCAGHTSSLSATMTMADYLSQTSTFTDRVPSNFTGYEATEELERQTIFTLREPLPLFSIGERAQPSFSFKQSNALAVSHNATRVSIRRGIDGMGLTKERQPIIAWRYEHSALAYLGRRLFEAQSRRIQSHSPAGSTYEICHEIIYLITRLVATIDHRGGAKEAQKILRETSDYLPESTDIVSVVADIADRAGTSSTSEDDSDLTPLLGRCFNFFAAVMKRLPGRIWPIVAHDYGENTDKSMLLSFKTQPERYGRALPFMDDMLNLYSSLIDDVVHNAIIRAETSKSVANRFEETTSVTSGVPLKQMSNTIASLTGHILTAFGTLGEVEPENPSRRYATGLKCIHLFNRLVGLAYGYGGNNVSILVCLHSAASHILDFFATSSGRYSNISLVITLCMSLVTTPEYTIDVSLLTALKNLTAKSADFIVTLLDVCKINDKRTNQLSQHLEQAIPIFVRAYAQHPPLRTKILRLLTAIVESTAILNGNAASIFGQFGPDLAQDAVLLMGEVHDISEDPNLAESHWKFFSSCVCNKQTWFTSFLLTGQTPAKTSKQRKGNTLTTRRKPVLETALDTLSSLSNLESPLAVVILQFISDVINHWPWAIHRIDSHAKFLSHMTAQLQNLGWNQTRPSLAESLSLAWRTAGAALVCEILAMYIHGVRLLGNISKLKEWSSNIPLLDQPGFKDPSFNKDQHLLLKKNFEHKFPSLTIDDLKTKLPSDSKYGLEFFYSLKYADELLQFASAWNAGSLDKGFRHEFGLANVNLALADAQRLMMTKWKLLCLELVQSTSEQNQLHKKLAYVAHECLEANKESEDKQEPFADLRVLRIDLATTIVQRLVDLRYHGSGMHGLLGTAWAVIRASQPDFDDAFAGDDGDYYRCCVKLLLLCLRPYAYADLLDSVDGSQPPNDSRVNRRRGDRIQFNPSTNVILGIATDVVGKGFRSLAEHLHEDPKNVLPHDFALLTSLLQSILQVRCADPTHFHGPLALALSNCDLGRYAIALFSWSNQIHILGPDPIYGDISISFLVEMSTLAPLAENLAADGILSRLNTADLMTYFLRPTSPFQNPARAHKIWSRGILPLVLNILVAVGSPFAAEAATFLNNYTPQLKLSSNALDSKTAPTPRDPNVGCVTLNAACEAHTLALISKLLDQFRANDDADIPPLAWNSVLVKEDAETWLQGTRAILRERMRAVNEMEVTLLKSTPAGDVCGCQNRLEELVLSELKGVTFVLANGVAAAASAGTA